MERHTGEPFALKVASMVRRGAVGKVPKGNSLSAYPKMERIAQPVERQHDGQETAARRRGLQPHLAASTGSACTSGIPEPSHVLRALGLTPAQSDASIRFSFGRFTTDAEIHQAATLVINRLAAAAGHSA